MSPASTAVVLTGLFVGLLRGELEVITGDIMRMAGVRRRAVLVGDPSGSTTSAGPRRGRSGIRYEFVGAVEPGNLPGPWPSTPWTS